MPDFGSGMIREFRGRMSRGGNDIVPLNFAIDERNCEFLELGVRTRTGFDAHIYATGNWTGKAVRVYEYKKRNEASRLLILDDVGNIWDSSTPMTTPILSIGAMSDFSAETMFDRVYISPHDGDRGLSNEKVYVYDGSGTARPAAGSGPSGYTLGVADGAAGNVEAGVHLFSVAYETASGHITRMGLSGSEVNVYTAPGSKAVDFSAIPVGPSYVVARWLMATKIIKDYDGNPNDKSWFFVPDGRIGDNTTTTKTGVSFFDASLVDSADRLLNQLEELPAGSCITNHVGRLCIGGERANDATARVSEAGYPESMSGLDGFINFNPGDSGGPIRFLLSYRKLLYAFKDYRSIATQDNGAAPSSWELVGVDDGQGTSVHGTAGVLDSKGQSLDSVVICTRSGISRFNGTFGDAPELTYMIEDLWKRVNQQYFHTIQLAIDPVKKKVYVCIPLDAATSPNYILMGDFNEGLSFDKIKWSLWEFPEAPRTCWVEVNFTSKVTNVKYGALTGLFQKNPLALNDHGNAITSYYRPGYVKADEPGSVGQFQAIRARVIGSGNLYLKLYSIDDTQISSLPSLALSTAPGKELYRQIGFFNSERASVEFGVNGIDRWFHLTKIRVASSVLWEEDWQS